MKSLIPSPKVWKNNSISLTFKEKWRLFDAEILKKYPSISFKINKTIYPDENQCNHITYIEDTTKSFSDSYFLIVNWKETWKKYNYPISNLTAIKNSIAFVVREYEKNKDWDIATFNWKEHNFHFRNINHMMLTEDWKHLIYDWTNRWGHKYLVFDGKKIDTTSFNGWYERNFTIYDNWVDLETTQNEHKRIILSKTWWVAVFDYIDSTRKKLKESFMFKSNNSDKKWIENCKILDNGYVEIKWKKYLKNLVLPNPLVWESLNHVKCQFF